MIVPISLYIDYPDFVTARKAAARVQTRSQPEGYSGDETSGCTEVASDFVGSGSDAAEILEAAKHGFDPSTTTVAAPVYKD